jgi:hypothetical protein
MTALLLQPEELVAITLRERPSAQARVLRLMGIPFRLHPTDGVLLVSRAAVTSALGTATKHDGVGAVDWDVNIEGIREHGKTQTPH